MKGGLLWLSDYWLLLPLELKLNLKLENHLPISDRAINMIDSKYNTENVPEEQ